MTDRNTEIDLSRQALGRPLNATESQLASALEAIFAGGVHDFAAVAIALNEMGAQRPSGAVAPWDEAALEAELRAINASLDEAYANPVVS